MNDIDYSKPFRVRITQDCREVPKEKKLDGAYGLCLGLFQYPDKTQKFDNPFMGNPLILTEKEEEFIWGCECWWDPNPEDNDIPLEEQQRLLEVYKKFLRGLLNVD